MEKNYRLILELILKFIEKDSYGVKEDIKLICETALKMNESGDEDVCS